MNASLTPLTRPSVPVPVPGIPQPDALEVNRAIEGYISALQEEFLIDMLGEKNGIEVHSYLCSIKDGEVVERIESVDAVCERLKESFADFVFFHMIGEQNTRGTVNGLVRLKIGNEYASPLQRQVVTWNTMVERNRRFYEWAKTKECRLDRIQVSKYMLQRINPFNL